MEISTCGVILAAGLGKRMLSAKPKALHQVGSRPMVSLVYEALLGAGAAPIIGVVSPDTPEVADALGRGVIIVPQQDKLGTGHATRQALAVMPQSGLAVVAFCDTPLLGAQTLSALIAAHVASFERTPSLEATLVTAALDDPTGYGRVIRNEWGGVSAIVEQVSCSPEQAAVREVFSGILIASVDALRRYLPLLSADNVQGEYLLTDVPAMVIDGGGRVETFAADPAEVLGVNTRRQLADANRVIWQRESTRLMDHGVTIVDPASTYVAPGVIVGPDTVIWPGSYLLGHTVVGARATIGPGAYLVDARLGAEVEVQFSTVEESEAGDGVTIGPYAHIRPGSSLGAGARAGNFAEIKNSRIGPGTKVSHHSYVGDADVGAGVNIGAGVVFVNYDGRQKHLTKVADHAFIGCNANLVAPVSLGRQAYVACGSTITRDVPAGALAVARSRQRNLQGWVERRAAAETQPEVPGHEFAPTQTDKHGQSAEEPGAKPHK